MRQEKSCGAVVYRRVKNSFEILVIKHKSGGYWSFPKGHMEPFETEKQTAVREVFEETGIEIAIRDGFRETTIFFPKPDTTKQVVYFLAEALNSDIKIQEEEIHDARWVSIHDIERMLTYNNDKSLIFSAKNILKKS